MIERLNQLSLSEFIELSCGDLSVLLKPDDKSKNDTVSNEKLKERATKLMIEYKNITDSTGMKAVLIEREDFVKEKTQILLLRICQTLISIDGYGEVCSILSNIGIDTGNMNKEQIKRKVDELLHTALFEQKRNDDMRSHEEKKKIPSSEQIRSAFDAEIAFLMTYFRMSIDIHVINAAIYANMVHQAIIDIEMKRRMK